MYPLLYIKFLYHFHYSRDYFECHEVLEQYWKTYTGQQRDSVWVGLIQLAVALYHYRRNNFIGASKLIISSKEKLLKNDQHLNHLGINWSLLLERIDLIEDQIKNSSKYKSFDLPIKDPQLLKELEKYANSINLYPNFRYDINETEIIHRHFKKNREIER